MKSGTIFDNILITDDEEYAAQFGKETWEKTKDPEKKMKDKVRKTLVIVQRTPPNPTQKLHML